MTYNLFMKFKNLKMKNLLIDLFIVLLYPIVKAIASEKHLLVFSDTCVIFGLALLIFGVINSFFLHGDMDITGFIANRAFKKDVSFDTYMQEQEEKRKDSFNYPLFISFILLILSCLTALFV